MPKLQILPQTTAVLIAASIWACTAVSSWVNVGPEAQPPLVDCKLDVAGSGNVRIFALGQHISVSDLTSFASLRTALEAPVSDVVAACLPPHGRSLLLFPAGLELVAAQLGPRGTEARTAATWAQARAALRLAYADEINAYRQRFPGVDDEDLLDLALTNPLRHLLDVLSAIAQRHRVPVVAAAETAVLATPSTDPADRDAFGDPEMFPVTTYVADTAQIRQLAFVFDATGALTATVTLPYGSRTERNDAAALRTLMPIEINVGVTVATTLVPAPEPVTLRVAILPGSNAWAPALLQRLADLGANLALYPAAPSGGWAIADTASAWPPDVWLDTAWAAVQRYPTLVAGAVATLSGNFGDRIIDGQSYIAVDAEPTLPRARLVGSDPMPGLIATGAWAVTDPITNDPTQDQASRRAFLADAANARAPGGAEANRYVASWAVADVQIPASGGIGFADTATPPHQLDPAALELDDGRILLAWTELAAGVANVAWGELQPEGVVRRGLITTGASRAAHVRLAPQNGGAVAVWMQGPPGSERIRAARFDGTTWGAPVVLDPSGGPQWWPHVAGSGERYLVAWTDLRGGWGHVRFTSVAGETIAEAKRGDGHTSDAPTTATLAPRIATAGERVVLAWTGAVTDGWAVYARDSTDAGTTFAPAIRVDTATQPRRLLLDDAVIDDDGLAWLIWNDVRDAQALPSIYAAFASSDTPLWQERRLDAAGFDFDTAASLAPAGNELWAVWQALSDGGMRLRTTHGDSGIGFLPPLRVLPEADPANHAWTPVVLGRGAGLPGVAFATAAQGFARIEVVSELPRE